MNKIYEIKLRGWGAAAAITYVVLSVLSLPIIFVIVVTGLLLTNGTIKP